MNPTSFDRVIWIVLDGVGAGELPDASTYGDTGSNTLGNLSRKLKGGRKLNLPNMAAWGLGNITSIDGVPAATALNKNSGSGAFGKATELSRGKDTTSGHWEMAGLVVKTPFETFPNGFPKAVIDRWIKENDLPGILGNKVASGTEIIDELGPEHLASGKPIVYTSADSVWQIAASEEIFGLERLKKISLSARKICDEMGISRVISRPFVGNPAKGIPFKRTYNRHDYAQVPGPTFLDVLVKKGIPTLGIGKISSIFADRGIDSNIDTAGNADGIKVLIEQIEKTKKGLIFCNLIDFDMLFGHRRDIEGFANALEEFDAAVPALKKHMGPRDLLIIASDHGNDPTYRGTDHTREFIPLLAYSPAQTSGPSDLGVRKSFGDVGATVLHALLGTSDHGTELAGQTFLPQMGLGQGI